MGDFNVEQRTKDGYFNATSLLKQWNAEHPNKERLLDNFWKSTHLAEFMQEIVKDKENSKSVESTDLNITENQAVIKSPNSTDLSKRGMTDDFEHVQNNESDVSFEYSLSVGNLKQVLTKTARGANGGTWMHPILFIKFAMYLNPAFEYQVIKFVADQMIDYRKEAGDSYRRLAAAVQTICPSERLCDKMPIVSRALDFITFNSHEKGEKQRNLHGTEKDMKELLYLERHLSELIEDGLIRSFDELVVYMRKKWTDKYCPKLLR